MPSFRLVPYFYFRGCHGEQNKMRRYPGLTVLLLLVALHSVFGENPSSRITSGRMASGVMASSPAGDAASREGSEKRQRRYREGTRMVDRMGYFQSTGDRLAFYTQDDEQRFPALENLALERVARVIGESTSDGMQWSVSGVLTEYRGENYLLVTRAILKSESGVR